ncbi:uncharacterized protein LOC114474159 [Gouania willdenowi]|uniref:Uncharacterized LOC114474159 n=1 Tax=Gouania willdenowi TaxID=441366 RepID=A0A8C5H290_GOUWI|nr:uncharacterized protein LOC114474159 [Gouania willdenowi]
MRVAQARKPIRFLVVNDVRPSRGGTETALFNSPISNMEAKLIVAVCLHPGLYDTDNFFYGDRTRKDLAWRKISEQVGVAEDVCRKKWKRLRNTYIKERRKNEDRRRGSTSKRWKYSALMSFLDPFVSPRETSSNMVQWVEEDGTAEYGQPLESRGKRAKKRSSQVSQNEVEQVLRTPPPSPPSPPPPPASQTEDEMFLRGLLPALQKVPQEFKEYAKFQIHKIIFDLQPVKQNLKQHD